MIKTKYAQATNTKTKLQGRQKSGTGNTYLQKILSHERYLTTHPYYTFLS